ncbi:unnamed protein product, partial [Iphiclides podalirius]
MPELIEQMYCSQQIVIPPKYPHILKRYCKAAIKTQPYDLLRWSYEYFSALAQHRPPPVKLRLEYPVYCTLGGLTRGCLKVLAHQLSSMEAVPLLALKAAWQGFCLDYEELKRILCLCDVYMREDSVPLLHFVAVAGGLLTKTLTHTMILVCETLTKEPDGGSAAIPVEQFLTMYRLLARMDASKDVRYFNGFREGQAPPPEPESTESEMVKSTETLSEETSCDDFWQDDDLRKLKLIDDKVARSARISVKLNMPIIGKIERSPSVERAEQLEREDYLRERAGEPKIEVTIEEAESENEEGGGNIEEQQAEAQPMNIADYVDECLMARNERRADLIRTFDEIAAIVDKYKTANYDLGMVAGRQMSTTSGEFIVSHLEREIMDKVNEQIAILPDPDLKKKKAKPEEVAMIREVLENFLDENIDVIVPEEEEAEEEEKPLPKIIVVYAVPGIGPSVDEEIIKEFEQYALDVSKEQADLFMPRNIRHFLCPPLEKYSIIIYVVVSYLKKRCIEFLSENEAKTEEVPTGGAITD